MSPPEKRNYRLPSLEGTCHHRHGPRYARGPVAVRVRTGHAGLKRLVRRGGHAENVDVDCGVDDARFKTRVA